MTRAPAVISAIVTVLAACGASAPRSSPATAPAVPSDPVWRERVAQAFTVLTKDSLHPAPAEVIAAAGWRALGEPTGNPSGEALADRVAAGIASHALDATRAWHVIDEMAEAADDGHTHLMSPDAWRQVMAGIHGEPFTAPGLVLQWTPDRRLVVSEVLAGGPAAEAGIAVGDVITAIDGKPPARTSSLERAEFVPVGATTTISIDRDGARRDLAYRARLYDHPVATHRTVGAIGIIRPYFFSHAKDPGRDTVGLARAALADFDRDHVTGIVLDLRGNQGGAYPEGYASLFTDADPVLLCGPRWEDRGKPDADPPTPWPNSRNTWPTRRPVAILIDEESVSAAEMVAVALREHIEARLFGQPSGGDLDLPGNVDLGDHHALRVPRVPVYTPGSMQERPRARVEPDETIPNRTVADLRAGRDAQLDAAMRWLATRAPAR